MKINIFSVEFVPLIDAIHNQAIVDPIILKKKTS
jgi:hypothetical protein